MTNAIIMSSLFPVAIVYKTDTQAKFLIDKAKSSIRTAEQEAVFGNAASISKSNPINSELVSIAVWHFEKALRSFREAISNLEQAKKFRLSARYKKYVEAKIQECYKHAESSLARKQQTERLLENLLEQK